MNADITDYAAEQDKLEKLEQDIAKEREAWQAQIERLDRACRAETKRADYWKAECERCESARAALDDVPVPSFDLKSEKF